MNIQLLLSANQGQNALSSAPAQATNGAPHAIFQQALVQASSHQPQRMVTPSSEANASDALNHFSELLTSLDIELNEESLADLLAQLQAAMPSDYQSGPAEDIFDASTMTPLDEIAARLSLVAAFSDTATEPQVLSQVSALAQQLAMSDDDAQALLTRFHALRDAASHDTSLATLQQQLVSRLPTDQTDTRPLSEMAMSASGLQQASSVSSLEKQPLAPFSHSSMMMANNPLDTNLLRTSGEPLALTALTPEAMTTKGGEPTLTAPPQMQPNSSLLTTTAINTPVTSPAWPSQLGQQLIHLAQRGGEHEVKMQLHPAELGPLSISLKVGEHGTQAHFLSAHAQVRQVLELAIPQLREALAEQGISLGETSVGEQGTPDEQAFAQQSSGAVNSDVNSATAEESDTSSLSSELGQPLTLDGRVDLYA